MLTNKKKKTRNVRTENSEFPNMKYEKYQAAFGFDKWPVLPIHLVVETCRGHYSTKFSTNNRMMMIIVIMIMNTVILKTVIMKTMIVKMRIILKV